MATSKNGLDIQPFGNHDVAGEHTINPMLTWMRNFDCMSEFLMTSVNGNGSISLDLDFPLLAGKILSLVKSMEAEFKATVSGNSLHVDGGHVFMPYTSYSFGAYTKTLSASDDGKCVYLKIQSDSRSWDMGSTPGQLNSGNTQTVLPVCQPYKSGNTWRVRQMHLGSFILTFPPHFLIGGYNAAEPQILMHGGNETGFSWVSAGDCNAQSNGGE